MRELNFFLFFKHSLKYEGRPGSQAQRWLHEPSNMLKLFSKPFNAIRQNIQSEQKCRDTEHSSLPLFTYRITSITQAMRPYKQTYKLNCRGWTTPFNVENHELGFQSAKQRKDVSVHLSVCSQWPQALSWHRQAYLRVCRNIKVYHHIHMWDVQTSACNISSQQNRTCLCLELV